MSIYLEGLVFGVVPVFFVGPVAFTLLHASLRGGFGAGALVALGIAVSDVCAIALCALGLGPLLTEPWGHWVLQIVGGLILLAFGVLMTRSRPLALEQAPESERDLARGLGLFGRGFVVNFVNPFVFTFWIGAIGGVIERHGYGAGSLLPFFGGVMTMILGTDLLKAWLAEALRHYAGGALGVWVPRLAGLALAGFGLYLLVGAARGLPG